MPTTSNTPNTPRSASSNQATSHVNVNQYERIASVLGGSFLAFWGMRGFPLSRLLAVAAGGALVYRGTTGHCPGYAQFGLSTAEEGQTATAVRAEASVTVERSRDEVYAYWRELENLPRFMRHLESVEQTDEKRSHWEAAIPGGAGTISWDAEITEETPSERLAWQSHPGAVVYNAGVVRFSEAPGGRGTEVHAIIEYRPPAGEIGTTVARFLNPALRQMVKEDMRRFKHVMEAGETPTIEGQPTG